MLYFNNNFKENPLRAVSMVLILKLRCKVVKQQTKMKKILAGRTMLWVNVSFDFRVCGLHCKTDLWAFPSPSSVICNTNRVECSTVCFAREKSDDAAVGKLSLQTAPTLKVYLLNSTYSIISNTGKTNGLVKGKPLLFARSHCWFIISLKWNAFHPLSLCLV